MSKYRAQTTLKTAHEIKNNKIHMTVIAERGIVGFRSNLGVADSAVETWKLIFSISISIYMARTTKLRGMNNFVKLRNTKL